MFNIEEIQGLIINGKVLESLTWKDIIITPANLEVIMCALNERVRSFDDNIEFHQFKNGYAVSKDGKYICHRNGDIFEVNGKYQNNLNGKITGKFYCDRAIADLFFQNDVDGSRSGKGYVNERGEIITSLPYTYCKNYGDNIAPVKAKNSEVWDYIDLYGGTLSEKCYKEASCFYGGTAIVLTMDNKWQLINSKFKVLNELEPKAGADLLIYYDKMADRAISDELTFEQNYGSKYMEYSIIDNKTKLSTFIDGFIDKMAQKFKIRIAGSTTIERLISLINTLSLQGTFILSETELDIYQTEPINGIKISTEDGKSIVSFNESIDSLRRTLEKK